MMQLALSIRPNNVPEGTPQAHGCCLQSCGLNLQCQHEHTTHKHLPFWLYTLHIAQVSPCHTSE
jgi:hypothetical protein